MKAWKQVAVEFLKRSLEPPSHELNELDWKCALSNNTERNAEHLSAYANYPGGGFMVYGITNGEYSGVSQDECTEIVKTLGNIARHNLDPGIAIDFDISKVNEVSLLLVYIAESINKPVHLRGKTLNDSYVRSAGTTRKMTKEEIKQCILQSSGYRYEEEFAAKNLTSIEVFELIDHASYFTLTQKRKAPVGSSEALDALSNDKLIVKEGDVYHITNLGAILFATNLQKFEHLRRKAVRVIVYQGKNRVSANREQEGKKGYAAGFQGLIDFVNSQLPVNEIAKEAFRAEKRMYPEVAIKELIANALIHQDFLIQGSAPMIEIFSDRIEITNPGRPIISINRFIDHPPKSRNEMLAGFMRRINLCEERGSGIDRVIDSIEEYMLPPPAFIGENEDFLKAILFAQRPLSKMSKDDKIRACFQHCCLKHVSNETLTNASLRKRLNISDGNHPQASQIIKDTIEVGLIRLSDPESTSRKYAQYVPFWAS